MHHTDPSAIGRVLASPFQQRRNAMSIAGAFAVLALCAAAPTVLLAWSLAVDATWAARLRHAAGISVWIAAAAVLIVGWAMLVGNVLQQNQAALARLVPNHVARLRTALLVAWAMIVLGFTAGPGFLSDAPLAWACGAAAGLALLALVVRWPALLLSGVAAPFIVAPVTEWNGHSALGSALLAQWRDAHWLILAIVVTAGAAALVGIVREQGRGPRTSHEARRTLGHRMAWTRNPACAGRSNHLPRPYAWWMGRLLARRDSPVMSRLLLGFGPTIHWTTRIRDGALFVAVGGGICAVVVGLAAFLGRDLRGVLPWLAFSLLTGVSTPALQAAAQVHRTRREQALLALLPGVPRGARLNRWLGWQMSVLFVLSTLWGFALAGALDVFAEALSPGLVERSGGGMTAAIAAAVLPQVALQWRSWARLGDGFASQFMPSLAPFLLGAVALVLHAWSGVAYLAMGVAFAVAAVAYCAWRWWRMGGEPSAMPIGRLAS
ncbi:MAG: hypothetical protein ACJ8GJ_05730 [Vitreoscilla sp.]